MYDQLKSRLASLLTRPRALKPQTERQLTQHLSEHSTSLPAFLLCASQVLEEYELDILFGPVFTPTLDERAELADLLFHWRPTDEQLQNLVDELGREIPHATVLLPDGALAKLSLHEVMIERFVRLLRLNYGPDAAVAAALRDAIPVDLWKIGIALLCERGISADHQKWFAAFVNHAVARRAMSRGLLQSIAEFVAAQPNLKRDAMLASAEALMRATEGTASHAAAGHNYWSADVAQHHHYRGQGRIDKELLQQRQAELEHVTALVEDLKTFEG